MKDNYLAMLWGLHVGDSLGATLEFGPPQEKELFHTDIIGGGPFSWSPGDPTDDTDMAIALLKSIAENKKFHRQSIIDNYLDWVRTNPKDIGGTIYSSLSAWQLDGYYTGARGERTRSNGSLMRCSPMALLPFDPYAIESQTKITHAEELCLEIDKVFIQLLQLCFIEKDKEKIHAKLKDWTQFDYHLKIKIEHIRRTQWDSVKTSGYVIDTFVSAVWALLHTDSFEDGLVKIVNRGDDSDTCGAVTGALLGAYYGVDSIPVRWLSMIREKQTIEDLVNLYLSE